MSPDVVTYTTLMKALIKAEELDQVCFTVSFGFILLHPNYT